MTFAWTRPAPVRGLIALLFLVSTPLLGQPAAKRLSQWLLEQPYSTNAYELGLSWRVPEASVPQTALLLGLMRDLSSANAKMKVDGADLEGLRNWLRTLPVTGRVNVPVTDARWLQANPGRDPVLRPDHTVILPARPSTVTVVLGSGERCQTFHKPGLEVRAYIDTCMPGTSFNTDWAWIAQPDGRVQHYGIASWNRQEQDEPAPGAWIWAPPRQQEWPEDVSYRLVSHLATQGPAPDAPGGSQSSPDTLFSSRSTGPEVSSSDWGSIGLLQTPSARMAKAGHFSFNFSRVVPYTQANIFAQPFDWFEAGFRYSTVSNRPYGPVALSGDQSYKDKSIDAKFRLWQESAYLPEVALGFRDLAGTGLFSGEYLVANKRTGDFDWSLGLGWGYLGARGNIRNPLRFISRSFDTRNQNIGQGGNFGFGSYFRGQTSLFGGVQYRTPWDGLVLKLEYDGNDYQHEPQGNNQRQSSPFNFGIVYKAARSIDLTVGVERGNTVMFGIALHSQLNSLESPKPSDPPRIPVAAVRPRGNPNWLATSKDIALQTEWHVRSIEQRGRDLRVTIDDPEAVYLRDRVDKAVAVLHRDAPADIDRFSLAYRQRGVDVIEHLVERETWVTQRTELVAPEQRREAIMARAPESGASPSPSTVPLYRSKLPAFEAGLGFDYQQTLGGPDAFLLFQISAVERVKWRLRDDTWLQASVRLGLIDNYDKFKFTGPSNLPRVRTFLREYLTTSRLTLPNLQATHVGKLGDNQFYSVYAGYLESMFGGVGAEWLYRAPGSRTAFGVDVNAVRQRNFEQDFGFRDYKVATGHATLYWDTGWQNVQAKLSVGRYLAKDFGATLDVSRVFQNGVTIGAFATKTNVSAEQFGEGSFDKGVYVRIPFDAMLTRSTNSIANFMWKPLTRDGGAMLSRPNTLHSLTSSRDERALWYEPAPRPNEYVMPADRREEWSPPPTGPEPQLQVESRPATAIFTPGSSYEHRLIEALYRQGFRNTKVSFDGSSRLTLTMSNSTLRPLSRAVGRAARTALRLSPLDTREIRIVLAERVDPVVAYDFIDLRLLERYFGGSVALSDIAPTIAIEYIDPSAREKDPLILLGDIDTAEPRPTLAQIVPGYRSVGRVGGDIADAGRTSANIDWIKAGAIGTGLVLASSLLDKRGFKYASEHADARWLRAGVKIGNALPWLGLGAAALLALEGSDPKRSSTAFAAAEAGGIAFLGATGLKYLAGRARPESGFGPRSFNPGSSQDAFPSRHAMVAWALATPFAEEYGANWLYGAAALTSLARIGSREHWVSDVVGGSLLGYAIGRVFWESSRSPKKGEARVSMNPTGVNVGWVLD